MDTVSIRVDGCSFVSKEQDQVAFQEIDLMFTAGKVGVESSYGASVAARQRGRFRAGGRGKAGLDCAHTR